MAYELSELTNTQRLINRGARTTAINMIKVANPSSIFESLNWDDFSLFRNDDGSINVSTRSDKYIGTKETTFTVSNLIHVDDVYLDLFGDKCDFYLEDLESVTNIVRKAFTNEKIYETLPLYFHTVVTEDNGGLICELLLENSSRFYEFYDDSDEYPSGYAMFLTTANRSDRSRLQFRFTPKVEKQRIDLSEANRIIKLPESSAARRDIYESVN